MKTAKCTTICTNKKTYIECRTRAGKSNIIYIIDIDQNHFNSKEEHKLHNALQQEMLKYSNIEELPASFTIYY